MAGYSYPEVGGTALPVLPTGYHHLRYRVLLGHGRELLEAAGEAVVGWRMHRAAGVRIDAEAPRAAPGVGVRVLLGAGPLRLAAPCRVVLAVAEPDRIGFAYGTEAGHPECGEESFMVSLEPDENVWFTVTAFSRPARWFTRLAGPVVPRAQRLYAWSCGRALLRTVRRDLTQNHP